MEILQCRWGWNLPVDLANSQKRLSYLSSSPKSLNSVVLVVSPELSAVQIPNALHHGSPKQARILQTHLAGSLVISQPSLS